MENATHTGEVAGMREQREGMRERRKGGRENAVRREKVCPAMCVCVCVNSRP